MKTIKIEKTGINGEGIGYVVNKPIFVMGALPQEVVEIDELTDRGKYFQAQLHRIIQRSPHRVQAICPIQKRCGACALMNASYHEQTRIKIQHLSQTLRKYRVRFLDQAIQTITSNPHPLYYRNQCKMPIQGGKGQLEAGFYAQNSNHFVPVETCYVHSENLERIRKEVMRVLNQFRLGSYHSDKLSLRMIILREILGQAQLTLITGAIELSEALVQALMQIDGLVSVGQSIQTKKQTSDPFGKTWKHLGGNNSIQFEFMGHQLRLKAPAFFQLNTYQAESLYHLVLKHIKAHMKVVDVYCGVGALSIAMAQRAKAVIGIELNAEAILSAKANAQLNQINNIRFIKGDAAEELFNLSSKQDCIVVDPPRSGLDDLTLQYLLKYRVDQLIYVSCNPSSLAKNLSALQAVYEVKQIDVVDMFSQTPHVECVVKLER
jgi:23S rRNA (uracil1939-C5)-methyltransferase